MIYLRLAGVILIIALVAALLWYRGNAIAATADRDKAFADLRVAVEANRTNLDAIARLQAEADANDRLNAELAEQLEAINAAIVESNKAFAELKQTNATVRDYLDAPVPDELRRLYDKRKAQGGGPH